MTADLRTQLAEVLARTSQRWVRSELYPYQADVLAAEVMPLIDDALAAARAEGAAEALRDAADQLELHGKFDEPVWVLLRDRARHQYPTSSALSAHTTEGDPT